MDDGGAGREASPPGAPIPQTVAGQKDVSAHSRSPSTLYCSRGWRTRFLNWEVVIGSRLPSQSAVAGGARFLFQTAGASGRAQARIHWRPPAADTWKPALDPTEGPAYDFLR